MLMKQQKAKTFGKDKIRTTKGYWRFSKKYDGHQVFIEKRGNDIKFFTSNHKQFNIERVRQHLRAFTADFIVIGEFLFDCDGKLGSRAKSSKVTTFRTNFNKDIQNNPDDEVKSIIKVFDYLPIVNGEIRTDFSFTRRRHYLHQSLIDNVPQLHIVDSSLVSFSVAKQLTDKLVAQGWEGGMLINPDSTYSPGKRVHEAIKLKGRHSADLLCIGVRPGEGKYVGMIGSLVLKDSKGREVSVGSGLDDKGRKESKDTYIGKVIEIEYEQITDTYIQPVYISTRNDKDIKEID